MEIDIYTTLNGDTPIDTRLSVLRQFIKQQLEEQKNDPNKSKEIAYRLAGLMSTKTVRSLDDSSPYLQALQIAGELELPEAHRQPESTWPRLSEIVQNIP